MPEQFDVVGAYADKGLMGLTIAGLICVLIWVARQWMLALAAKDALNDKHRDELVKFALVTEGVKHALENLVEHQKVTNELIRDRLRERARQ